MPECLFQVVLTDRGSEFTDPLKTETKSESGELICRVFYCGPQNSKQKRNCERIHEFIRYIIPKNKGKDKTVSYPGKNRVHFELNVLQ